LKVNRLLAGTLALVLIAGISPTFAEVSTTTGADPEDIIFNNGDPNLFSSVSTADQFMAEDFELTEDAVLEDVHFSGFNAPTGPIEYLILKDDSGKPGDLIKSGESVNLVTESIVGTDSVETWFDLDEPVSLNAGTKHWIAMKIPADWHTSLTGSGEFLHFGTLESGWEVPSSAFNLHMSFVLTGQPTEVVDGVVGGELLPIDNTALVLAGAQSFSWMIPVVLSVLGIGLFVVSRKSE